MICGVSVSLVSKVLVCNPGQPRTRHDINRQRPLHTNLSPRICPCPNLYENLNVLNFLNVINLWSKSSHKFVLNVLNVLNVFDSSMSSMSWMSSRLYTYEVSNVLNVPHVFQCFFNTSGSSVSSMSSMSYTYQATYVFNVFNVYTQSALYTHMAPYVVCMQFTYKLHMAYVVYIQTTRAMCKPRMKLHMPYVNYTWNYICHM